MNEIKQTLQQDADALLKRLQQSRKNGTGVTLSVSDVGVLCEEIEQLKAQLNKIDEGWVSVLVKEPPIDQTVLICWSDSPDVEPEKDYMTVDEDLNHYWANFHKDNPSHWMPLPKEPSHD